MAINKYEVYDVLQSRYKCRKTDFNNDGYVSQEYSLVKDGEINHDFFDFQFELMTCDFSGGKSGFKLGEYKVYNSLNQPLVLGKYSRDDKIGIWTYFYYDQGIKIESNLHKSNDEKYYNLTGTLFSGEFTIINEDNIKEVRTIKNGLRDGKTEYFNSNGEKIKKEKYKEGVLKD